MKKKGVSTLVSMIAAALISNGVADSIKDNHLSLPNNTIQSTESSNYGTNVYVTSKARIINSVCEYRDVSIDTSYDSIMIPTGIKYTEKGFGESKEQAVSEALAAVIEKHFGVDIKSDTIIRDSVTEKDDVMACSSGTIANYLVNSIIESNGLYVATITADIGQFTNLDYKKL